MKITAILAPLAALVVLAGCSSSGGSGSTKPCDAACQSQVVEACAGSCAPNPSYPPAAQNAMDSAVPATVASAAPTPDTIDQQVSAWWAVVSADFDAIQKEQTELGEATGGAGELIAGCQTLKSDVRIFEADPSAPDATLRADLSAAMDSYSTAATECIGGDFTSAASDIGAGTTKMQEATARIQELAGS